MKKFRNLNYTDKVFYFFTIFSIGLMSLVIAFIVSYIFVKNLNVNYIVDEFIDFGDFFNVLHFIKDRNPYYANLSSDMISNYPPLAYLVLYPFSLMAGNAGAAQLIFTARGLISLSIFYLFTFILLAVLILKTVKNLPLNKRILILISIALSYPVLFLIDRGNIGIVSLICILFFYYYNKSENKILRELSLIFLSAGIAVKLYPVLFLIILIRERRMIDLVKVALYSFMLFFLPFLFFIGGLKNFSYFLEHIGLFVNHTFECEQQISITFLIKNVGGLFNLGVENIDVIGLTISMPVLFFAIIAAVFIDEDWKAYILVGLMCAVIPSVSFIYSLVFVIPGLIKYLNSEKRKREIYFAGFILFLMHFSFISHLLNSLIAFMFISILIVQGLICLVKCIKNKNFFPYIKSIYSGFFDNGKIMEIGCVQD